MNNGDDCLFFEPKNACAVMSGDETGKADRYCAGYIDFLDAAKTEREAVSEAERLAGENGFILTGSDAGNVLEKIKNLPPGGRIAVNHRGKNLALFIAGKKPFERGVSIVAAHADSPRLDLKTRPLYEEAGMAFLDTHYYGMIKTYQWTGIPLALRGFIARKDGTTVTVRLGEAAGDPVFLIADLLPHLAGRQMEKRGKDMVEAEALDVLAGIRFRREDAGENQPVKLNVLRILREKYGVTEADFVSAELAVVPAFGARELGFDRGMIGAYGQDDKVCVYTALTALCSLEGPPEYGACVLLADKEETGSMGMSGLRSVFFRKLMEGAGVNLPRSFCLSADVNAAYCPLHREVFSPRGEAAMNHGVVLFRYWGRGGKENTNEASAETVAALRAILDDAGILWQTGEGGRVDAENSGTLAHFLAEMDLPTVDLGVPLLSMHSPFEVSAKTDVYMAHRAFGAFFRRTA